ncbi:MAG: acyl-CoA thioesterase [Cypionkella sp.]
MLYHRRYPIEFNHCDPAGIVFYPRYFEMTNHVCENFFREAVGVSYAAMIKDGAGVPTVRIETDFRAPSRLGDVLDVTLEVVRLGASSVTFEIVGRGEAQVRLVVKITLVWVKEVDGVIGPQVWTEPMREKLAGFLREA